MGGVSRLVWLFSEHRELNSECERLRRVINDLEHQLAQKPAPLAPQGDFIKQFVDTVLQDEPFPDNKIPEGVWLTPEDGEPVGA